MSSSRVPINPCPACGFVVFAEPYGSYELCPICKWEDDGVQLANPCSPGGANGESLYLAQRAALSHLPLDVREHEGFSRCSSWRPISDAEATQFEARRARLGLWSTKAVDSPDRAYWSVGRLTTRRS